MSNYKAERFKPKVPVCFKSKLSLLFDGNSLILSIADKNIKKISYPAASGKLNEHKKFDYSLSRQKMPFLGPIPEGNYWIKPSELWKNAWYRPGSTSAWGNYRLAIHPYPSTKTYGRGGFFIHGGRIPGSAGCIDLTSYVDQFIGDIRKALPGSKECYIPLTVKY